MNANQDIYRDVLSPGVTLHGYVVKSVLGRGPYSATYLVNDKGLDQLVVLKEYFPQDFSTRASHANNINTLKGKNRELFKKGLSQFIKEARMLEKFKHRNIIRVLRVFEFNSTAYMAMEYEQGEDLSTKINKNKNLSEQTLLDIFVPIAEGLHRIHNSGIIHRNIKPENIFIRKNNSPVLFGFGVMRKLASIPGQSTVACCYAPYEQYNEGNERQGAWTDIYALGACLYLASSGKLPPDAATRGSSILHQRTDPYKPASGKHSSKFLQAIDQALMFLADDRPEDLLEWLELLKSKNYKPTRIVESKVVEKNAVNNNGSATKLMPSNDIPSTELKIKAAKESKQQIVAPIISKITRLEDRWNVKLIALTLVILVLLGGKAMMSFWEDVKDDVKIPDAIETFVNKQSLSPLASLLAKADEARKQRHFLQPESGAMYIYLQALKLDPANLEAKSRIQDIIELYADLIRSDMAEKLDDRVKNNIKLLQAAVPISPVVLALLDEVRTTEKNRKHVYELLQLAISDLKAQRIISPKSRNALFKYRRILEISPDNPKARQGVATILQHYIKLAKTNLAENNIASAKNNIKNIALIDPDSFALEELRYVLQARNTKQQAEEQDIKKLLEQAQVAFTADQITRPANKNALALYQRVLTHDKNNTEAKQGIANVEAYLKSLFQGHLSAQEFKSAKTVMRKIERIMPGSTFSKSINAEWIRRQPVAKSDADYVAEIISQFKQGFESGDLEALNVISKFKSNRKAFLQQFFDNYTSFELDISDVNIVSKQRKATAKVAIVELVNIQGASIQPGTWSRFEIVIRRNIAGKWKIIW